MESKTRGFYFFLVIITDTVWSAKSGPYPTRWPYPVKPKATDWAKELKKRPSYHTDGHRQIDAMYTEFLEILSRGDPAKRAQLTLYHEWFPLEALNCFDRVRDMITKLCVDWRWNPYAQKFSYIVLNMCNAVWLSISDIEDCLRDSCMGKRVTAEDLEK